jgi:hypothetical protein
VNALRRECHHNSEMKAAQEDGRFRNAKFCESEVGCVTSQSGGGWVGSEPRPRRNNPFFVALSRAWKTITKLLATNANTLDYPRTRVETLAKVVPYPWAQPKNAPKQVQRRVRRYVCYSIAPRSKILRSCLSNSDSGKTWRNRGIQAASFPTL